MAGAHLERYWHPQYEYWTHPEYVAFFEAAIPNQEERQKVLDASFTVSFLKGNVEIAFAISPTNEIREILVRNLFHEEYQTREVARFREGQRLTMECHVYSRKIKKISFATAS